MDRMQIAKATLSAIESNDFETVQKNLHEDYQLTGATPQPLGKKELLKFLASLKAGLPDFAFNASDLKEAGGKVTGANHITGTHTATLDLSFLGIPPQAATGNKVKMPEERFTVEFIGDQVSRFNMETSEGGGIAGLLHQLGVTTEAAA